MICEGIMKDVKERLKLLKEMNQYEFETDEAYAYWIEEGVPDNADEDDLAYIATNVDIFNAVQQAFVHAKIMDIIQRG